MRIEHDALGEVSLPDTAYYGCGAERHRVAFDVGPFTLDDYPMYVRAVALLKIACARANAEIGALDAQKAAVIEQAAWEVAEGKFKGNFGINIFRGSGTPLNAAVNEVIAHRANELLTGDKTKGGIQANTHVNMAQSSNDVIPSAKDLVIYWEFEKLVAAADRMACELEHSAERFADVLKLGRTGLQDAVPETLGQILGGHGHGIRRMHGRMVTEMARWCHSCLGGTAVGTGMGCMPGFRAVIHKHLSDVLGRPMTAEEDLFDGMMAVDGMIIAHAHMVAIATQVWKLARDVRLMASGERSGFMELKRPLRKPGQPDAAETLITTANRVTANQSAVMLGVQGGWLDLGASSGMPIRALISSAEMLSEAMDRFTEQVLKNIEPNREHCAAIANQSTSISTMISTIFGYDVGSKVAHYALDHNLSCRDACLALKILPADVIEEIFDLKSLVSYEKMEELFRKYRDYRKV